MNDYLREALDAGALEDQRDRWTLPTVSSLMSKDRLRARYAYAIPNDEAIAACVKHSPIVEIGAGLGYWARLITEAGGDVVAYDKEPGELYGALRREHPRPLPWFDVHPGDASEAAKYPDRTLMLCWPPYGSPMAYAALRAYAGSVLIYIGEGHGGCTADGRFHGALRRWRLIEEVEIPQLWGLHDRLFIYERRRPR